MWLTEQKTKNLGYNLWYQLYLHPECKRKYDLKNCGEEAAAAYEAVKHFAEACPFCEYDSQTRILFSKVDNPIKECHFCPLQGVKENTNCCSGHFRNWYMAETPEDREREALIILTMIKNWIL